MENYSKHQIGVKKKVPNIFENYFEQRGDEEVLLASEQTERCRAHRP